MLAATHALVLSQYHCPPSCHNNELGELLDRFCSDKGTFWQSKHHYHTAYHSVFGSIRKGVRSILEVGIGEDTAPSVAAWTEYFPNAHIFPVDIKSRQGFDDRAKPGGATAGVAKHQAKFGCVYNASMWKHPRVHLTLDTDASEPAQLQRIPNLPELLDIIIDDGSHRFHDQETMLLTLWPRLRPGGFYVVEDVLVGALPWDENHAKQVCAQFRRSAAQFGALLGAILVTRRRLLLLSRCRRQTPAARTSASSRSAPPSTRSSSTASATSRSTRCPAPPPRGRSCGRRSSSC